MSALMTWYNNLSNDTTPILIQISTISTVYLDVFTQVIDYAEKQFEERMGATS